MDTLLLTTIQAGNTAPFTHAMAGHIRDRLHIPTRVLDDIGWAERRRRIGDGAIQLALVCGLPYVRYVDEQHAPLRLLVAPIMHGARYGGRPIYFSELVVHAESGVERAEELRGITCAYNEAVSHSGYSVFRYYLSTLENGPVACRRAVCSGAHVNSLRLLGQRRVDAAAIDSTIMEWVAETEPALLAGVRVLATIGPSPIPAWVVADSVPADVRAALEALFLGLHESAEGRAMLATSRINRFTAVVDADYDPIREMARAAERIPFLKEVSVRA